MVPGMPNDREWVKHREVNEWIMHFFPFFLVIEHRRTDEQLPFVGSLKGALCTMRDCKQWGTLEEAQIGMIEWAMDYTMELYQDLGRVHEQVSGG